MVWRDWFASWMFRIGRDTGPDRAFAELERKYLWTVPLAVLLSLIGTALEGISIGMLIPLLGVMLAGDEAETLIAPLQYVADTARAISPEQPLLVIGAIMLTIVVVKNVIGTVGGLVMSRIDGHMQSDLRSMLARRLLRLPYSFYLTEEHPRLVNIISSDSWRASEAVQAIYGIASSLTALIVLSSLAAFANWKLFLIVIGGGLAARLLQQAYSKRVKRLSERVSATNRDLGERMLLTIDLARLIRIFNQEKNEQALFDKASHGVRQAMYDVERASAFYGPLMELLLASLFVTVLVFSQRLGMSVPEVLAFLVLQYRLQPHVMAVNEGFMELAGLDGSIREVEWLMGPEDKPAPQLGAPLADGIVQPIRFEHVTYTFPFDPKPVIHDASFEIVPGEATALIGRSGAGKSTLINLLLRMFDPQEGAIRHGDRSLADIDPASWRARIALAGQDVDLVEGTVADNIAYRQPGLSREEIETAARIADAHDFIVAMPDGYDHQIGSYGMNLSGGQRQRIALARALARKPDLLILDEATNAVDGISETAIMRLLREHRGFGTAIVISHRRSTLSACTRGVVVDQGRIVEAGPLRDLRFYREMERWPEDFAAE